MSTHRIAVIPGDGIGRETEHDVLGVLGAAPTGFGGLLAVLSIDCPVWPWPEAKAWIASERRAA